ncbi:putative N-acetyltransferase [Echria macrotheca]|uniref:N-acetyltransferase n=1 Tax=Echria macrotheca TaxID=438768 RepID=A0AAJ0F4B6_9PEZI|nr:putative N-acetyltransferase [Echria macrotheca]
MTPQPILSLKSCVIRPLHVPDAEQIDLIANNPKLERWLRNGFPYSQNVEETRAWIVSLSGDPPSMICYGICAADNPAVVMGTVGFKAKDNIYHRTVEIGYWLGEEFWGRGIAGEAITAFTDWVFTAEQFKHVLRIEAEVFSENKGSARVLQKAGFELEGRRRQAIEKHGVVMDSLLFGKLRNSSV